MAKYLIYNREYELLSEVSDFKQVKDNVGDDIREQDVNSLTFLRGKTVITEDNIKRLIHNIVETEKDTIVEYITDEIENQEDETVELRTTNSQLTNKLDNTHEGLALISEKLGGLIEGGNKEPVNFTQPTVKTTEEPQVKDKDTVNTSEATDYKPEVTEGLTPTKEDYERLEDDFLDAGGVSEQQEQSLESAILGTTQDELDEETLSILSHIENSSKAPEPKVRKEKSASKVIPNRRRRTNTEINFITVLEGGKITQINNLKGNTFVKTDRLAEDIGLDREHVEYLIQHTLKECGGTPKYQNTSVVSPAEAVWIIVSALTKRSGFGSDKRFTKTQRNAEDFYRSWDKQKEEITGYLE